ncbi:hypothetical protein LZC95_39765 [Pendulispora brunnea]|uniref:Uncharacterized protein n=1 Tax=Pendulispora brunnea TaxID=2905690 RepID=A0ABZ2K5D6_9BACT
MLENGAARFCIGSRGARLDAHLETGAPVRRIDAEVDGTEFYELARALREHLGRGAPFREADMLPGTPHSSTAGELEPPLFRSVFATDRGRTVMWCTCFLGLLGVGGVLALANPSGPAKEPPQATRVVFEEAPPKKPECKLHDELCCNGPGQPLCRHCSRGDKPPCCNGPGEPRCCGYPGAPPCEDPANWWRREPDIPGY